MQFRQMCYKLEALLSIYGLMEMITGEFILTRQHIYSSSEENDPPLGFLLRTSLVDR